jgi:hypothetical protein
MGDNRQLAFAGAGEDHGRFVIAAEFQIAAELFGVDRDASFLDFDAADVPGGEPIGDDGRAQRQ